MSYYQDFINNQNLMNRYSNWSDRNNYYGTFKQSPFYRNYAANRGAEDVFSRIQNGNTYQYMNPQGQQFNYILGSSIPGMRQNWMNANLPMYEQKLKQNFANFSGSASPLLNKILNPPTNQPTTPGLSGTNQPPRQFSEVDPQNLLNRMEGGAGYGKFKRIVRTSGDDSMIRQGMGLLDQYKQGVLPYTNPEGAWQSNLSNYTVADEDYLRNLIREQFGL